MVILVAFNVSQKRLNSLVVKALRIDANGR